MPFATDIIAFSDMHVHFRHDKDEIRDSIVPYTARCCRYAVVMPDTEVPTVDYKSIVDGRKKIIESAGIRGSMMTPLMTFKFEGDCTPEIVREAHRAGAVAGKVYPDNARTDYMIAIKRKPDKEEVNPKAITREVLIGMVMGHKDYQHLIDSIAEMEKLGMLLLFHGELPGEYTMDREKAFLPLMQLVLQNYKRLKVVMEHITESDSVRDIVRWYNQYNCRIGATITLHHMFLTLDDVLGGDRFINKYFCKPIAKSEKDRQQLRMAAFSGEPMFFLGTDSAPHTKKMKDHGCAGCFTAPILLQTLPYEFGRHSDMNKMEKFATLNGPTFYGIPGGEKKGNYATLRVTFGYWTVPNLIHGLFEPFFSGERLEYNLNYENRNKFQS